MHTLEIGQKLLFDSECTFFKQVYMFHFLYCPFLYEFLFIYLYIEYQPSNRSVEFYSTSGGGADKA